MSGTKLNVSSEEVHGDTPEGGERVKLIISEAHLTSSTENVITHERNVERVRELGPVEMRLHAMNYALNNTYVIERAGLDDVSKDQKTADEYVDTAIAMADRYLAWLTADDKKCEECS